MEFGTTLFPYSLLYGTHLECYRQTTIAMISSSPRIPLASMPIVIPTLTLGRAWVHELDVKLAEAGKAGLQGIELFWEDLVYAAKRFDPEATETSEGPLLQAAQWTRGLCDQHRLEIYVLQPFLNYDGLVDSEAHNRMIKKLHLWFKIAKILRTDIIQVASQVILCHFEVVNSYLLPATDEFRRNNGQRGQDRG